MATDGRSEAVALPDRRRCVNVVITKDFAFLRTQRSGPPRLRTVTWFMTIDKIALTR